MCSFNVKCCSNKTPRNLIDSSYCISSLHFIVIDHSYLCCCNTNWHFSFVIIEWKVTSSGPKFAAISSKAINAGSCNICRNMRWILGILRFLKFYRCCVYVSHSLQCSRNSWKQVAINGWTLQIVAFVIQCFWWLIECLNCSYYFITSSLERDRAWSGNSAYDFN